MTGAGRVLVAGLWLFAGPAGFAQELDDRALIQEILRTTEPLPEPRGDRLPLYLWPAHRLGTTDDEELDSSGIRRMGRIIAHLDESSVRRRPRNQGTAFSPRERERNLLVWRSSMSPPE